MMMLSRMSATISRIEMFWLGFLLLLQSQRGEGFSLSSLNKVHHTSRTVSWNFPSFLLAATVHPDTDASSSSQSQPWFPTRIQESIDYDRTISRLYLRHVVTETRELADLALQHYLEANSADPFEETARTFSACTATRSEGGRIGWIERDDGLEILPQNVVQQVFAQQPKAGDIVTVQSNTTGQWHVVQVVQVWLDYQANDQSLSVGRVGSHLGQNVVMPRRTLKGRGVTPQLPSTLQTYTIQTAGCQMNVADSERLEGMLQNQLGLEPTTNQAAADVVLLNTCSIRDHAEQKVYDALGPFAARKRQGQQFALIVTGCVAQQEGQDLIQRIPEIDVVLGPSHVPHLTSILQRVQHGQQVVATAPTLLAENDNTHEFYSEPVRGHSVRAWVNVIHGCNEHCTYCVVPAVRGMEQSRTMESILQECLSLQENGYKEVTLLGQNIDAYGRDMVPKRTFAELLEHLNANLQGMRIRYVTSHPRYFSDRVIDAVANLDQVCECFHMPFQAGSDKVLRDMRRGYTYESYLKIIHKIRRKAPDASICGDVIVGFPGETEEQFQRTLDLMEQVKFDNLNTFAYSPRPNTEAALWDNQVSDDVKAYRLQRVQALAAQHGLERSQRYVGGVVEVLVEDWNPRNPNQVMGRTRQGRQVYFDGRLEELQGEFVDVRITQARTWSLMGEQVAPAMTR